MTQVIKKQVLYRELEAVANKMHEDGYRLACLMPEFVDPATAGAAMPTTVCCVFEKWNNMRNAGSIPVTPI